MYLHALATALPPATFTQNECCQSFTTLHQPANRDRIRFEVRQGKLRNLLHPSVLFALERALRDGSPDERGDWWLTSFGAGFSAHGCRVGL